MRSGGRVMVFISIFISICIYMYLYIYLNMFSGEKWGGRAMIFIYICRYVFWHEGGRWKGNNIYIYVIYYIFRYAFERRLGGRAMVFICIYICFLRRGGVEGQWYLWPPLMEPIAFYRQSSQNIYLCPFPFSSCSYQKYLLLCFIPNNQIPPTPLTILLKSKIPHSQYYS